MRIHQKIGVVALSCLAGLTMWGCPKENTKENTSGASTPATGGGAAASKGEGAKTGGEAGSKKIRIAVIPKGTANSFWLGVKAGADDAAKEAGSVDIIWQGPATENDVTQQVDVVQNQINNQVDGIVLAAVDSQALVQPVKTATDKHIPVVTVDSGLAKGQDSSICYIATDNTKGGQMAADNLATLIGKKGNVGILIFQKGSASNDERENGFLEAIKKYPDIHVVSNLLGGDPTKAVDQTNNMLTANKDLAGIFAANQPNGEGAASVLKQKSLGGKVKLVAFDSSADEITALNEGTIQALIVQDPYQMGYQGVKNVMKAIHKETVDKKLVDSGVQVVTKENLNTPAVQKLLKPGT